MGHNGRTFGRISENRKRFESIIKNQIKRRKWRKNKEIINWGERDGKVEEMVQLIKKLKEKETGRNKLLEQRVRETARKRQ